MKPNMIKSFKPASELFRILAHPARLAILTVLREGEQCVCHMEAALKLRQAYISQQLKMLKDAGIVTDRRDGWNIFYQVSRPEIFNAMEAMSALMDLPMKIEVSGIDCPCPKCNPTERNPQAECASLDRARQP
jgi:DNA-binding transcriptional ArsR family regulator